VGGAARALVMRLVLVIFGLAVMVFALLSDASIYRMVQNAYKVTLVSAFAPLVLGLYWKHSTVVGSLYGRQTPRRPHAAHPRGH
jgi:Na+(H+)/acetate symporter ActP